MKTKKFIAFKVLSFISGALFLIAGLIFTFAYMDYFEVFAEYAIVILPLILASAFITLGFIKIKQKNYLPIKVLTFIFSFVLGIIFLIIMIILTTELSKNLDSIIDYYNSLNTYLSGYIDTNFISDIINTIATVRVLYIFATILALIAPFTLLGAKQFNTNAKETEVIAKNVNISVQTPVQPAQPQLTEAYIKNKEAKVKDMLDSGALTKEEYDLYVKKEIEPLKAKLVQSDPLTVKIQKIKELKQKGIIDEEEYKLMLKNLF